MGSLCPKIPGGASEPYEDKKPEHPEKPAGSKKPHGSTKKSDGSSKKHHDSTKKSGASKKPQHSSKKHKGDDEIPADWQERCQKSKKWCKKFIEKIIVKAIIKKLFRGGPAAPIVADVRAEIAKKCNKNGKQDQQCIEKLKRDGFVDQMADKVGGTLS